MLPDQVSAMVSRVSGIVSRGMSTRSSRDRSANASPSTSTTLTSSIAPGARPALRSAASPAYLLAISRMVPAL